MIKRLCVFCGSSSGFDPAFLAAARALGESMTERGIGLVFGGAAIGLMGAIADVVADKGGEVIGVMPQALVESEVPHRGLADFRVVGSMHERKALMADLSDGFVALPGGLGTFEELFEIWTWAQLDHHAKPCALLNVSGFYDDLLSFLDGVVRKGFVKPVHRDMLLVADRPESLLEAVARYEPPVPTAKWIASTPP